MPLKSDEVPNNTESALSTAVAQLILKPQQSSRCELYHALTLLVNSEIIQRCSINVHTGKCTSGKGHVMGGPKNENFSATTVNTKAHNLDNCNCTETWFSITSLLKMYKVILSGGYQQCFALLCIQAQISLWPGLARYLPNDHEISSLRLPGALKLISRLIPEGTQQLEICLDSFGG